MELLQWSWFFVIVPQILGEFGAPPIHLFALKDCMQLNFLECTAALFVFVS